ncbi:cytochrome c oxidase subunit 4 isoform 1, mitochondrial-like [Arctopsyche grandis]|uniref:cytochrome c oxidase subunit 4 isoform 1, mitochondrial-like n=1 Tax=Arctopsyche grandis TaxID=121162 RepID=UPI00406D96BC
MAGRILTKSILDSIRVPIGFQTAAFHGRSRIGSREIVGHGMNGQANYQDRIDYPMPSIRFREDTADVKALREKEKGDWRKLTVEEKKTLYRASFCQTFAEFNAPDSDWKHSLGWAIFFCSLSLWIYMGMKMFVLGPLPETFDDAHQKAQLKRMLDIKVDPVDGLSSKWDYENKRWK